MFIWKVNYGIVNVLHTVPVVFEGGVYFLSTGRVPSPLLSSTVLHLQRT